ncbi:hypothetical protein B9479_001562 [Cryptococcus floricola]|uniref:Uncharacterized protein n=1 Tax=Cryptococcus floricola TaxID=2591691 RepID=A0A5D3B407_9TREE|nr:hypothetical protein B9479_001562 [Cryptococcus floricola]
MSQQPIHITFPSVDYTMSQRVSFSPHHSQPFTLEEAVNLELDTLITEVIRLTNSLEHLYSSQDQLQEFLESEEGREDPESQQACIEAIRENEELMPRQNERIALLAAALINKVRPDLGIGAPGWHAGDVFRRYGEPGGGVTGRRRWWASDAPVTTTEQAPASGEEEGLHL